jgi:hypothetical protein
MADEAKSKVPTIEYVENGIERQLSSKVDIQHNNPLSGLSRGELHDQVEAFCGKYGFEDKRDIFHRASLVAQRPHDFESIQELTDDDKYWLRREITSRMAFAHQVDEQLLIRGSADKWDLPWTMYTCM